jgi:hypothetical protein
MKDQLPSSAMDTAPLDDVPCDLQPFDVAVCQSLS